MASDRALHVLRAIVQDYVASREPVGSKAIVDRHQFGVSAATIRNDMVHESDRIRDAQFDNHLRIREIDPPDVNARALAAFLSLPEDTARALANTDHLFAD